MKKITFLFALVLLLATHANAQTDSIFVQNTWRKFILHLPAGYTTANQYPLVINLHGLAANGAQQQLYSQFDNVADTAGFIVVYPDGLNNQWNLVTAVDVDFISQLVDTLRANYSCNSCLFATGMSNGGFMSYKLACEMPQPLTAVAVVSGNMSSIQAAFCAAGTGLPVMHMHGTSDLLVNYNGSFGVPPVDTTIRWWVNTNSCNVTPVFTAMPNISIGDSCTVEKYYYGQGINGSEVTFYKIINGGHTWPGGFPLPLFGFTNYDINASYLIGGFFQQFCPANVGIAAAEDEAPFAVFPNPAGSLLHLQFNPENVQPATVQLLNLQGVELFRKTYDTKTENETINCTSWPAGLYFLRFTMAGGAVYDSKLVLVK
jgi:polyhydroxybutyrate depolymerase